MAKSLAAGSAYVPVLPMMKGFQKSVATQVGAQSAGLAATGRKAGASYGKGMAVGAGATLGPALKKQTNSASAGIGKSMATAGRSAGTGYGKGMAAGAAATLGPSLKNATDKASSGVRTSMARAGSSAGTGMAAAAGAAAARSGAIGAGIVSAGKNVAKGSLLAVGIAAGATIVSGVRAGISQENAQRVFTGLYGSGKQATDMMKELRKVSSGSALSYDSYLKAGQSLAYAGVKGKEATQTLRNVGKAISAAGGTDENLTRATDAILKMVNAGKVQLDTLQQLSDAGVPILSGLAKHFGVSISKVNKMASEGKIELDDVMTVMRKGTGKTFQQMIKAGDKADKSFGNTFKRIKDDVTSAIGASMVPLLQKATPYLEDAGKWLQTSIPLGLKKVGDGASKAMPYVKEMALALFKGEIDATGPFAPNSPVIKGLFKIRDAAMSVAGAVRDYLVKGFEFLKPHLVTFGKSMADLWPNVKSLAGAIGGFLKGAFQGILPILKVVGAVIGGVLVVAMKLIPPILRVVINLFTGLFRALKPLAPIIGALAFPFGLLGRAAVAVGKGILGLIKTLGNLAMRIPGVSLLVRGIGSAFTNTGKHATWLWKKAIQPAWKGIRTAIGAVSGWLTKTVWPAIRNAFTWIGNRAKWLNNKAIKPAFQWIRARIRSVTDWLTKTVWPTFRKVFTWIGDRAKWLYTKGIRPAFKWIRDRIQSVYKWLRDTVWPIYRRVFTWIADKALWLYRKGVKPAFDWIRDKIRSVANWFRDKGLSSIRGTIGKVKDVFEGARKAIGKTWSKIRGVVARPINAVVGFVANKLVGGLAKLKIPGMDSLKKSILKMKVAGYDRGGWTGPGSRMQPAGIVHADEHVISKPSRRSIESVAPGYLDALNRHGARALGYQTGGRVGTYFGQVPGYAKGGRVGSGHTWPLIWNYVRKKFPGDVRMTSNYRPGSQSLRRSSHALGTAIDIAGPVGKVKKVMKHMQRFGRNMRDLIYTPLWGSKMISDGKWIPAPAFLKNTHRDHGHIGLLPGRGLNGGPASGVPGAGGGFLPDIFGPFKKAITGLSGKFSTPLGKVPIELAKQQFGKIGSWATDKLAALVPDVGVSGAIKNAIIPAATRTLLIKQALGAVGLNPNSGKAQKATYRRAQQESGWDAKAINNWDSNARRGTPSKGLMQMIDPTFRAFKMKGAGNIWNPLHNLIASMRYVTMDPKYGRNGEASLLRAYNRRGGYARGTASATPGLHWVGEQGPELVNFRGGERVFNAADSRAMTEIDYDRLAGAMSNLVVMADGRVMGEVVTAEQARVQRIQGRGSARSGKVLA